MEMQALQDQGGGCSSPGRGKSFKRNVIKSSKISNSPEVELYDIFFQLTNDRLSNISFPPNDATYISNINFFFLVL